MLTTFEVENLRSIKGLKLHGISPISLIVGGNNSGKTTLLDALHLLLSSDAEARVVHAAFRFKVASLGDYLGLGTEIAKVWGTVSNVRIQRTANINGVSVLHGHGLSVAVNCLPFSAQDLMPLFSAISDRSREDEFLDYLRQIDATISDVRIRQVAGDRFELMVASNIGKLKVSLANYGQGFIRFFGIFCRLIASGRKFALIDEIETGIHYASQPTLWKALANISKSDNIQIFATTHSLDCVRAALDAFESDPTRFGLIRMERDDDGNTVAVQIPYERVRSVLENELEIR